MRKKIETQIDHLVYQLYNRTPDEISIVEGGRGSEGAGRRTPDAESWVRFESWVRWISGPGKRGVPYI